MADAQIGNIHEVAACGISNGNRNGGAAPDAGYSNVNLNTIAAMKARLTALQPTWYPANILNAMTENDLKFAIRSLDNPTTIKQ